MTTIRLGRYEAETGRLPAVCMRCGAPAVVWKDKKFTWIPPWLSITILGGLLPYVILARILQLSSEPS